MQPRWKRGESLAEALPREHLKPCRKLGRLNLMVSLQGGLGRGWPPCHSHLLSRHPCPSRAGSTVQKVASGCVLVGASSELLGADGAASEGLLFSATGQQSACFWARCLGGARVDSCVPERAAPSQQICCRSPGVRAVPAPDLGQGRAAPGGDNRRSSRGQRADLWP